MKKIMYLIIIIIILTLTTYCVQADCTDEEISFLKKETEKINVTYKHLGEVADDEGIIVYDRFNVTFNNINDDFYVSMFNFSYTKYPENGVITDTFTTGNWCFEIYSKKCEKKIDEIKVALPKFNVYSLDSLCDGISGDEFALCSKYYDYNVSYDSFKERVLNYRTTHKIDSKLNNKNNIVKKDLSYYWKYIRDFVINNIIIFVFVIISLIIIIPFAIVFKIRKSRGVLK